MRGIRRLTRGRSRTDHHRGLRLPGADHVHSDVPPWQCSITPPSHTLHPRTRLRNRVRQIVIFSVGPSTTERPRLPPIGSSAAVVATLQDSVRRSDCCWVTYRGCSGREWRVTVPHPGGRGSRRSDSRSEVVDEELADGFGDRGPPRPPDDLRDGGDS